ncbi:hypothetical protein GP486_006897 [Trichoglossum hirsutum]|uniref:PI-PLC Y-box domain-containing protein n=1 Tax=Trichoglossum hirsutum TaxID=265104 RepID=A0A9P8IGM4_9PEZI|nr:hypothetical protein GP486_006897 [Trichoglossum hirsutum]
MCEEWRTFKKLLKHMYQLEDARRRVKQGHFLIRNIKAGYLLKEKTLKCGRWSNQSVELRDLRRGKDISVPRYPAVEEQEPQKTQFVDVPERSEDENLLYRRIFVLWKCRICRSTESFGVSGSEEDVTICNHCYEKGRSRAIADTKDYALPREPGIPSVSSTLEEWARKRNRMREEWTRKRNRKRRANREEWIQRHRYGVISSDSRELTHAESDISTLNVPNTRRIFNEGSPTCLLGENITPLPKITLFYPSSAF